MLTMRYSPFFCVSIKPIVVVEVTKIYLIIINNRFISLILPPDDDNSWTMFEVLTYSHTLKGGILPRSFKESNCGIDTDNVKQQRLTAATPKDNALPFWVSPPNCLH